MALQPRRIRFRDRDINLFYIEIVVGVSRYHGKGKNEWDLSEWMTWEFK